MKKTNSTCCHFDPTVLFNIPKFMEAEIRYETNATDFPNEPYIEVTPLRKDPDYAIYYNNWARLAVLGIVPFLLLVYFNTKIYKDIQVGYSLTVLLFHLYSLVQLLFHYTNSYYLLFMQSACGNLLGKNHLG